ncbi:MAG TPA: DUF6249 domain-containing protein [Casimicrobiaceae bacterium]|nr:DUF6249 domain-containing protein [Casimicrobiaceae bacterium]
MNRFLPPAVRRLVLGSALAAAMVAALLPDALPVHAAAFVPVALAQGAAESAADAGRAAKDALKDAAKAAKDASDADDDERPGRHRITIGIKGDRQYDSFDQFLDSDPALASMVLGIVFIVFLTPILIIGLIIWYKMRKNRMQQDTMLRLAEKGIVPPADALQAVAMGRTEAVVGPGAPLAEQAQSLTRRAAWSDLRKGVIAGTIGLAICVHGLLEDRTPGWLGLILLFVGIGYIALWFFEDRQAAAFSAGRASATPVRGPGDIRN